MLCGFCSIDLSYTWLKRTPSSEGNASETIAMIVVHPAVRPPLCGQSGHAVPWRPGPLHSLGFPMAGCFVVSRGRNRWHRLHAKSEAGLLEKEEEDEKLKRIVLAIADEIVSLVPVVGPMKDAVRAGQEQRLRDYCYHVVMLLCDLTPMVWASEAARMAELASKIAKLVRAGKKGYSLRKVAAAAKQLLEEVDAAKKLSLEIRTALKTIHKVCVRLADELDNDNISDEDWQGKQKGI